MAKVVPLPPEKMHRASDPSTFSSDPIPLPERIIGQDRAAIAMEFGIAIESKGYNIFLVGPKGTGKSSIIESLLRKAAALKDVPSDWCLVYNFRDPDRPRALELPPGHAAKLKKDMTEFGRTLQENVTRIFESKDFEERRSDIVTEFQEREADLIAELDRKAEEQGFVIKKSQTGFTTIPVVDAKPLSEKQMAMLSEKKKEDLKNRRETLNESIREAIRRARRFERQARERVKQLERKTVSYALDQLMEDLQQDYEGFADIQSYFKDVKEDILENIDDFKRKPEPLIPGSEMSEPHPIIRYQVNVLVDNSKTEGAPVIVERHPTYYNLFGKLERKALFGALVSDFTMIKSGSFLQANGGYLVVEALDVMKNPFSWDGLKRAIQNSEVQIEDMGQEYAIVATAGIRPQPIPVNVKVIMIGNTYTYAILHSFDEDFTDMFKVKADFDYEMDRTVDNERSYASFLRQVTERESLLPFNPDGIAAVVEYGSRMVENQDKLTTQFSIISDLAREANFYAARENRKRIGRDDVEKALDEKYFRMSLTAEKYQEWLEKGIILIDTRSSVIGQVNGLAVYNFGDFVFGKPSRITATTFAGKEGVMNIERQAGLSGKIHDKGLLILSGFLSDLFSDRYPFALGAKVCFEQSYDHVDGDSASSTELLAILSSLADLPLSQSIAVTGSVNQKGEYQPVGGVNFKIEGFFEVCRRRKLNGKQGVIIPHQNVRSLMLKPEVVEACRKEKFHIYPVKTIFEAIEILSGVPAGEKDKKGHYPDGTVLSRINTKLQTFSRFRFAKGKGSNDQ